MWIAMVTCKTNDDEWVNFDCGVTLSKADYTLFYDVKLKGFELAFKELPKCGAEGREEEGWGAPIPIPSNQYNDASRRFRERYDLEQIRFNKEIEHKKRKLLEEHTLKIKNLDDLHKRKRAEFEKNEYRLRILEGKYAEAKVKWDAEYGAREKKLDDARSLYLKKLEDACHLEQDGLDDRTQPTPPGENEWF